MNYYIFILNKLYPIVNIFKYIYNICLQESNKKYFPPKEVLYYFLSVLVQISYVWYSE